MRNASRTSSLETSRGQLSWAARGLDQAVERSGGSSRARFAPRVAAVVCLQNGRGAATRSLLATNFQRPSWRPAQAITNAATQGQIQFGTAKSFSRGRHF